MHLGDFKSTLTSTSQTLIMTLVSTLLSGLTMVRFMTQERLVVMRVILTTMEISRLSVFCKLLLQLGIYITNPS